MIDFNQEHPFENAIGEYLLYNRGKQSKSKWKLDAKQPFEDYKKQFLPKLNKTSTQLAIDCVVCFIIIFIIKKKYTGTIQVYI